MPPVSGALLEQMLELAAFVAAHGRGAAGVVLGGDLNAAPDTLEMAVLQVGWVGLRKAVCIFLFLLISKGRGVPGAVGH